MTLLELLIDLEALGARIATDGLQVRVGVIRGYPPLTADMLAEVESHKHELARWMPRMRPEELERCFPM